MPDLGEFNGRRLFITGGTGFFGTWLLRSLDEQSRRGADLSVTVLSRDPSAFLARQPRWANLKWLSFVRGNVSDFVFPDAEYDLLIHAATHSADSANAHRLEVFNDIVAGTRHVLDFAVRSGVQRVLLTSSGAVYGTQPVNVPFMRDDAPLACRPEIAASAYGEGKRAMELLGTLYCERYGIEPIVARCFAFFGAGLPLDGGFAIGNFVRDAIQRDAIRVWGDGSAQRSYLYGGDLATWLLHLLAHGTPCYPYNVGSDRAISIGELADLVRCVLAPEKEVLFDHIPRYGSEQRQRYVPAIDRARALGLDVWTGLEEGCRKWSAAISTEHPGCTVVRSESGHR